MHEAERHSVRDANIHHGAHHGTHGAHAGAHGNGEPIIYSVTGTLSGTLSGTLTEADGSSVTFTDASFSWRLVGNTASLETVLGIAPGPAFEVPALKDTIKIGDHTLSPTIPTVFATASVPAPDPFGIAGFSDAATNQGLANYDGISPVCALPVTFDNAGPLPTTGGELAITGASNLHFSAVVV
jgi:hypothetical protein